MPNTQHDLPSLRPGDPRRYRWLERVAAARPDLLEGLLLLFPERSFLVSLLLRVLAMAPEDDPPTSKGLSATQQTRLSLMAMNRGGPRDFDPQLVGSLFHHLLAGQVIAHPADRSRWTFYRHERNRRSQSLVWHIDPVADN